MKWVLLHLRCKSSFTTVSTLWWYCIVCRPSVDTILFFFHNNCLFLLTDPSDILTKRYLALNKGSPGFRSFKCRLPVSNFTGFIHSIFKHSISIVITFAGQYHLQWTPPWYNWNIVKHYKPNNHLQWTWCR